MKVKQLRTIMTRYGVAGVLFVGVYLLLHHYRHHRRPQLIAACAGFVCLFAWWLVRPAPRHRPAIIKVTPLPAAPPAVSKSDVSLEDDTAPGPPLPAPDADAVPAINGSLYFAAQYYRESGRFYHDDFFTKPEETLEEEGPAHLYRVNADGSHRRRLTWGNYEDRVPSLSPDGRHLAFIRFRRDYVEERAALCLMNRAGGHVTTLVNLQEDRFNRKPCWSPDGRQIAVREDAGLVLLDVRRHSVRRFPRVEDFAWSPDGRLYLRDEQNHARILRPADNRSVPVKDVIRNPLWLDAHTLIGDMPDREADHNDPYMRFISDKGMELRRIGLHLIGRQNEYATFYDEHVWYRLPRHKTALLLETWRWMSDGDHCGCYRVDTTTGKCRLLQDGALMGIAPDGDKIAVADWNWVGPYKRGGAQVGPLKLVSLRSGRSRAVTDPLACIMDGEWRPGAAHKPSSLNAALLAAVEEGDAAKVRSLLTQGASANAGYRDGGTALMTAAGEGNTAILTLLLRHHLAVNAVDQDGRTALMAAVGAGKAADETPTSTQKALVLHLLKAGAHINAKDHAGQTALMYAATGGRARVVELLLEQGAAVNVKDKQGWTALMQAADYHCPHTVLALLKHGADTRLHNEDGATALRIALEPGGSDNDAAAKETESLLRKAGAEE